MDQTGEIQADIWILLLVVVFGFGATLAVVDARSISWGIALALVFGLTAVYYIRKGFREWWMRQLVRDTPNEPVRSLSIGHSEITGEVVTGDRDPIQAPFTDDECVVAQYQITSGEEGDGAATGYRAGVAYTPFYVEDGTGQVLVRPSEETEFDLDTGEQWAGPPITLKETDTVLAFAEQHEAVRDTDDTDSEKIKRAFNITTGDFVSPGHTIAPKQTLVQPGDSIYILGPVQNRETVPEDPDNPDRLVFEARGTKPLGRQVFFISDDEETNLIERYRHVLWRAPAGGFLLLWALVVLLFIVRFWSGP